MKKLIALLFTICIASLLSAQKIDFSMGSKTNKKIYAPRMVRLTDSPSDENILVVEPQLKAINAGFSANSVKGYKIRLCDMEWKDSKTLEIPNSKGFLLGETFRNGNSLNIMMYDYEGGIRLRIVSLDIQNFTISRDEIVCTLSKDKGYDAELFSCSSPNGEYYAAVCCLWPNKSQGSAVALLFDDEMNKLWQRELVYSDITDVILSNDGDLATIALGSLDGNKNATAFRINAVSDGGEQHAEYTIEADLTTVALLNYIDGRILATALEGSGGNSKITIGALGHRNFSGITSLVFDLDKEDIAISNRHPFTNNELNALSNSPKGTPNLGGDLKFIRKVDACQTPNGGAVLYQHAWSEESRDMRSGASNLTVHSKGILVVQVDMKGEMVVSPIMQNNQNASWPHVGADLFATGDKVYILTNESGNEGDVYTPLEPAKRSLKLLAANSAASLYWFTADGFGAKQVLQRDEKAILFTPAVKGENGRYFFLAGGMFPSIARFVLP